MRVARWQLPLFDDLQTASRNPVAFTPARAQVALILVK